VNKGPTPSDALLHPAPTAVSADLVGLLNGRTRQPFQGL